jgi:hypothetical protein
MNLTGKQLKNNRAKYRTMTAHRPRRRTRYLGTAIALLLTASSIGASAESPARTSRYRSSIEDCKAIVEVGKYQLGWSPTAAPAYDFYADLGDYIADCSWKDLGVAEPRKGTQWSLAGFVITRPVYDGASARVDIHTFRRDTPTSTKPQLRGERCELERGGSEWSVRKCSVIRTMTTPPSKPGALIQPVF